MRCCLDVSTAVAAVGRVLSKGRSAPGLRSTCPCLTHPLFCPTRPLFPLRQMRCYDVSQLSMKFDRHLDSEIVDFQILSEDYSKAVFLCADRRWVLHQCGCRQRRGCCTSNVGAAALTWVLHRRGCCTGCGRRISDALAVRLLGESAYVAPHAALPHSCSPRPRPTPPPPVASPSLRPRPRSLSFHARFGAYYKTRVPKFGRDLAYCPFSAELLVAASAPEVRWPAGEPTLAGRRLAGGGQPGVPPLSCPSGGSLPPPPPPPAPCPTALPACLPAPLPYCLVRRRCTASTWRRAAS